MSAREALYEAALVAARPLARIGARSGGKLARGLAGRTRTRAIFERWARSSRDHGRPLAWLHAPSVGEALMAQAIIASLRERRPDCQIAFTIFSPSAERVLDRVGADVAAYAPLDTRWDVRPVLDALAPGVIAFVRTEVWPVLGREAASRGARVALVNGVLGKRSSRLRLPARALLGPAYARLDAIGAVGEDDARRFTRLGIASDRVSVTGDARFDQVCRRLESVPASAAAALLDDAAMATVVAGSTWPVDEALLLPAFAEIRHDRPVRLVVAPHEPDETHLARLEASVDDAALGHRRLGAIERAGGPLPEVVIVDRVGVLADLYRIADAAYVGGGFGDDGLHSVIEPAALGVPVTFGPHHGNAVEGGELAGAGGAIAVTDAASLAGALRSLLGSEGENAGAAARDFVARRRGGAACNAELIDRLMASGSRPGAHRSPAVPAR